MNAIVETTGEDIVPGQEGRTLDIHDHVNVMDEETIGCPFVDNAKMSARNVNVFYDEKQAITDVSLDIGKNEVLAMIGSDAAAEPEPADLKWWNTIQTSASELLPAKNLFLSWSVLLAAFFWAL